MYLAQAIIDRPAAVLHATAAGLTPTALKDETAVLKTVFTEALAGPVIRPWRVQRQDQLMLTVIGYTQFDSANLETRLRAAPPSAQAAIKTIQCEPLELPPAGSVTIFEARICPVVHVTAGREGIRPGHRDAFLVAVDHEQTDELLDREEVYRAYLAERLQGAELLAFSLDGFRIPKLVRKSRKVKSGYAERATPVADVSGLLRVTDQAELGVCLAAGVGRQRAFGAGLMHLTASSIAQEVA